jgi:restriction endonuclease S subunit
MSYAYLHNAWNRKAHTVTISASGASAGFVNFWREPIFASDCTTVRGLSDEESTFLYYVLKSRENEIQAKARGLAQPHVYPADIESVLIPKVDDATRRHVICECEAVDAEVVKAEAARDRALAAIQERSAAVYASKAPRETVGSLAEAVQYGLNEKLNETGTGYRCFRMNEIARGHMVDGGSMKCADIFSTEFAKYKLNRGDLLLIRSNGSLDNIGRVGIFNMDGDYCFASYLVRVVPDTSKVETRFLAAMLTAETSRRQIESLAVKSGGTNNLSAGKMKALKIPVPPLPAQKKFVAAVEALEQKIADAEAIIAAASERKNVILAQYL